MVTSINLPTGSRAVVRHPQSAWNEHRPAILNMYLTQNMPIQTVLEMLASVGFLVTKSQLEYKLKQWKAQKNIRKGLTQDVWRYVDHHVTRRQQQGKDTEVLIEGKVIAQDKLKKEINRYRLSFTQAVIQEAQGQDSPRIPDGCDVSVRTPGATPDCEETLQVAGEEGWALSPSPVAQTILLHQNHPEKLFSNIREYIGACFELKIWVVLDENTILSTSPTATPPNVGNTQCNPSTFFEYCSSACSLLKTGAYEPARVKLSTACAMVQPILMADDPRMLQVFLNILVLLKHEELEDMANHLVQFIGNMARLAGAAASSNWARPLLSQLWQTLALSLSKPGTPSEAAETLGGRRNTYDLDVLFTAWHCMVDMYRSKLGECHETVVSSDMELLGRQTETRIIDLLSAEIRLRRYLRTCEDQGEPTGATPRRLLLALGFNLHTQGRLAEAANVARDLIMRSDVSHCSGLGAYLSDAFGHELLALCYEADALYSHAMPVMLCAATTMASHHGWEDPWVVKALGRVQCWNDRVEIESSAREDESRTCTACSCIGWQLKVDCSE